jgi:hypothetical protein
MRILKTHPKRGRFMPLLASADVRIHIGPAGWCERYSAFRSYVMTRESANLRALHAVRLIGPGGLIMAEHVKPTHVVISKPFRAQVDALQHLGGKVKTAPMISGESVAQAQHRGVEDWLTCLGAFPAHQRTLH